MAKVSPLAFIPPVIFLGLASLFYFNLGKEGARNLPSTMIGRQAPELNIVKLRDDPAPTAADLTAPGVKLVNFWASWCVPCRAEHPFLMEIANSGIKIIGINYKDSNENGRGFLAELGDPFYKVGADLAGRTGIDWGVYGIPETFVVDGTGKILLRNPGPINRRIYEEKILPVIKAAQQQ